MEISQVVDSAVKSSQIGKSTSRASLQNQLSLKKAMEEAQKLSNKNSLPPVSPIEMQESTTSTILHVLKDISETEDTLHETKPEPPILNVIPDCNQPPDKVRTTSRCKIK